MLPLDRRRLYAHAMSPTLRRPLGILALFVGILAYALFVVWLFEPLAGLHPLLQAPLWLFLGIAWVVPVRPLVVWIETGHWRVER
jgi:hypothetical protein